MVGEKGKKKEKRVEKQREEAERNRKKNRMKDWLIKRNLGKDSASYGNASYENASYGNASYGNASGVDLNAQDVVQNVAEIVSSFVLERLEVQQPVEVNDGRQTLEEENLVSRGQGSLADQDKDKR